MTLKTVLVIETSSRSGKRGEVRISISDATYNVSLVFPTHNRTGFQIQPRISEAWGTLMCNNGKQ